MRQGRERIPVDPVEYLRFAERLDSLAGEVVDEETMMLLLYSVSRVIAENDKLATAQQETFHNRIQDYAEILLDELHAVRNPEGLRLQIRNLKAMTQWWLNHFEERAGHTSGS